MTFRIGGPLDHLGPRVSVEITIPARARARNTRWSDSLKAEPVGLTLLIDTGATETSIRENALRWLGLVSHERGFVRTMSHEAHPVDAWEIDLTFVEGAERAVFRNLQVLGCAPMGLVDGVLGRDVLNYGSFAYEGIRKRWSLELHPPMTILG